MSRVSLVSVVRNAEMYRKCILSNPYAKGCDIVTYNNNDENLSIPIRYNSYLDSITPESDVWIVFCHEDWMPLCDMEKIFANLDRNYLYGPIGVKLEVGRKIDYLRLRGRIFQTLKDGSKCITIHGDPIEGPADTFDCQCLAFHSSLLKGRDLRFDENLQFDMYVEDFCARANEEYGIGSRTVNLPCKHFSYGDTKGSFVGSLDYMKKKYASCQRRYPTTVGHNNTFGGDQSRRVIKVKRHSLSKLIYLICK